MLFEVINLPLTMILVVQLEVPWVSVFGIQRLLSWNIVVAKELILIM